jgi:acetylornithine deacetylase/succinyl-diaminopimelate desuccinylase-like protein
MATSAAAAVDLARRSKDRILTEMRQFLSIPSVSSNPSGSGDMKRATEWLEERFMALGLTSVQIIPTGGHPVVYGELAAAGPAAPTVLIYGHYDVQSAAPLGDWNSDPYRPVIRGDDLFARGSSDNKGQIMACIAAVEAMKKTGPPPVNIKFVIEGEEELGSPNFAGFLRDNRNLLAGDFVLNPDAGMLGPETPTIYYGLRGMYVCNLRVYGPVRDLHSGSYGGVVHNPIHALSHIIAGLHRTDGRVTLEHFYDRVRELTAEERAEMATLPRDEASYLKQSGVSKLWGEPGFTPVEREGARPAIDVVHIVAGSPKSAIPAEAHAIITARLVPDQDPNEVHESLMAYLTTALPPTVRWETGKCEGFPASLTDRKSAGVQALARAMEIVWGTPPVFCRSGGSIAAVGQIQKILGLDSVLTGFALPDAQMHGPNEKLHIPTWERGIEALVHFFYLLAGEPF